MCTLILLLAKNFKSYSIDIDRSWWLGFVEN